MFSITTHGLRRRVYTFATESERLVASTLLQGANIWSARVPAMEPVTTLDVLVDDVLAALGGQTAFPPAPDPHLAATMAGYMYGGMLKPNEHWGIGTGAEVVPYNRADESYNQPSWGSTVSRSDFSAHDIICNMMQYVPYAMALFDLTQEHAGVDTWDMAYIGNRFGGWYCTKMFLGRGRVPLTRECQSMLRILTLQMVQSVDPGSENADLENAVETLYRPGSATAI